MTLQHKLLTWIFVFSFISAKCQQDPFTGSDKLVDSKYNFSSFDKISIVDVDGVTEIEVGKPFSVETQIKDKYTPILEVKEVNRELIITFKYTKDNNKYINNPGITIKICCPTLVNLSKKGNSNISVAISNQLSFVMTNEGNGSAKLIGFVKQLNVTNDGNGKIDAEKLLADTVFVSSFGNGDVLVCAKNKLDYNRNGNGRIIQVGAAAMNEKKKLDKIINE